MNRTGFSDLTRRDLGLCSASVFVLALILIVAGCSEPEASLESVRALHGQQRYAESIEPLDALLLEQPNDRELLQLYSTALLAIGEPALAIWPLRKLAESPEAAIEDRIRLARAHLDGGLPEDAVAAASLVLDEHPSVLEALQVRIEALEALNNYEDGLADVQVILDYEPDHQAALLKKVMLLLSLERADEAATAIATLKKVAESAEGSTVWTGRLCAVDATFIYERREGEDLGPAREAWANCLKQFPTEGLVVSESVGFFDAQGELDRATEILRQAFEAAPESVDFQIALGQRLAALGQHEEGERLLLEATNKPAGLRAWKTLLEYYEARRDLAKARSAAEKMLEIEPSAALKRVYADLLIRVGDFEAAPAAIRAVEEPEFRNLLEGRLLLDMGKPRQALERLDEGIRVWPSHSVARQLASEAAEQIGDFDRAIAELKEAVRADASNLEALDRLARYQRAMGRAGMLSQVVHLYVRDNPRDPRGYRHWIELARWTSPKSAMEPVRQLGALPGYFEEAVAAGASLREGEPKEAVAYIEKHELDLLAPASREVLAVWIKSQSQLGKHALALARVDAAIAAHADVAELHVIRADALAAAGRPAEEVRASLERALSLAPGSVSALVALAKLETAAGKTDEAVALYDRALATTPGDDEVAWAAIELLVAQGSDQGIERRASTLLAMHPYHAGAAHLLARRLAKRKGDLDRARGLALRAVRFGGGPEARTTLGWIELERGETTEAIGHLRAVLKVNPNAASANYHLGRALAKSGDAAAARAAYEKALAGDPFPEAEAARAELARLGT